MYQPLKDFLDAHSTQDFKEANVSSFNGYPKPGKWKIPEDDYIKFCELIYDSANASKEGYHHFVEKWNKNFLRKAAFDLDLKREVGLDFFITFRDYLQHFKEDVNFYVKYCDPKKEKDGSLKYSYHIVCSNLYGTPDFLATMADYMTAQLDLSEGEIDKSIYRDDRGLRMTFSKKGKGDERFMFPLYFIHQNGSHYFQDATNKEEMVVFLYRTSIYYPNEDQPKADIYQEKEEDLTITQDVYIPETPPPPWQNWQDPEDISIPSSVVDFSEQEEEIKQRACDAFSLETSSIFKCERIYDGYKIRLQSYYCMLATANHDRKEGRCITVGRKTFTYTCLNTKCVGQKLAVPTQFTVAEVDRLFGPEPEKPEKKKSKKKKEEEESFLSSVVEVKNLDTPPTKKQKTPKLKKTHELLLGLSAIFKANEFARMGSMVYKPIKTQDGRYTGAYEKVESIADFVSRNTMTGTELWFISATQKLDNIVKQIMDTHKEDPYWPTLKPKRLFRSFKNYQWDMENDKWLPHTEKQHTRISIMYWDVELPEWITLAEPNHIDNGDFELIFEKQGYTKEEIEVIIMMLGRLQSKVGKFDMWQVYMYMLGGSGCGKSSIIQALSDLFPFEMVGVFSSETSKDFALDKLYSKKLILAPEMDNNLAMRQTTLQSIISGTDPMTVTGKFKADKFIRNWTAPIIGAGNKPLGKYAGEAISRRTLVVEMDELTTDVDNTLIKRLKANIPSLAIKGWRLYMEWVGKVGSKNIWDFLPKRFVEANLELKKSTTPFIAFLESDKVTLSDPIDPNVYCPVDQFRDAFIRYCSSHKKEAPEWNKQLWSEPFKKRGIKIEGKGYRGKSALTKPWPRRHGMSNSYTGAFVIGIDIVL
jgi:hypothetical protein